MNTKLLSIILFALFSYAVKAQEDTLNRYDANNKRTGWWIVYLDKDLAVTKDTSKALYYRYSYFDGRFDYFNMGPIGSKKNPVIPPEGKSTSGIGPLDGEYKANYNDGQIRFVLTAKDGKLTEYREYYKNGTLMTRFDYTKSCGDTQFHYCIYQYHKDGSLKYEGTIQTPKQ